MEVSAITGAALVSEQEKVISSPVQKENPWRKTTQPLMPHQLDESTEPASGNWKYNIYPYHPLKTGSIYTDFNLLGEWIAIHGTVIIDGFVGTDWTALRTYLNQYFEKSKISVVWYEASSFLKPAAEVDAMVMPFLGEPGTVWGKKTTLKLRDFFNEEKIGALKPDSAFDVNIIIGEGAALCNWDAPVIYMDLPKNELQYRMRAGSAGNLATSTRTVASQSYKRYYFVDWVVLNEHRKEIKDRIEIIADGQWRDNISWTYFSSIKNSLAHICHGIIRVRPWFEAGAWGGQWLKKNIPELNQDEVNYAWSFELIVPENGLVFEHNGNLLEISFDWLMEHNNEAVLGKDAARFGNEFPIRFDFLDTFDGGNLSIQCHPSLDYIQEQFGERITQDETYYIMDCKDNAQVYLGFQENIDAGEFRSVLENSYETNSEIEIEKYVQKFPSKKHELYLIPNGTIHSSGTNNLVLEISATPYIFTFKMYDWLRLDLNGEPRPINIDHGFKNLNFNRKGKTVEQELISKPVVLKKAPGYQVVHLPTHADHFYDIHRIDIIDSITLDTNNQCHVLMLVEGSNVVVITERGDEMTFNYAETFVIPAATSSFKLVNKNNSMIKVIKAFIK